METDGSERGFQDKMIKDITEDMETALRKLPMCVRITGTVSVNKSGMNRRKSECNISQRHDWSHWNAPLLQETGQMSR
jgi:hypothetical protein